MLSSHLARAWIHVAAPRNVDPPVPVDGITTFHYQRCFSAIPGCGISKSYLFLASSSMRTSRKALLATLGLIEVRCDQAETAKPVFVVEGGPVMLLVATPL